MHNISLLQIFIMAMSAMILAVSAAFVIYWKFFGKKHHVLPKREIHKIQRAENPGLPIGISSAPQQ